MMSLMAIAGCNGDDKPAKAVDSEVFKTQTDALEKARAVEQTVLDAAARQREQIEQSAQ